MRMTRSVLTMGAALACLAQVQAVTAQTGAPVVNPDPLTLLSLVPGVAADPDDPAAAPAREVSL